MVTLYNDNVIYFENSEIEENNKVFIFQRRYKMNFSYYLRTKELNQTSKFHLPKKTEQFRECDEWKKIKILERIMYQELNIYALDAMLDYTVIVLFLFINN